MALRTVASFVRNLTSGVNRAFAKKSMRLAGELAILQIVQRTRKRGVGVSKVGGKESKLKPLHPNTIEYRKRLKDLGKLHPETNPRKSNLTSSGRLLDSMVIKEVENKKVIIGPKNNKRQGENITNEEVGRRVSAAGRPFNFLSDRDITKLSKLIDDILQEEMRRL